MKARLGELQARLESHEARRSQSVDAHEVPGNTTPNSFHSKSSDIICLEGSASPSASHHSDSHLPPPQHHHHHMTQQMMHPHQQPNLYEQPVEDPENSLFSQAAARGLLNSPPTSQPSPSPHGLLSPPTHMDQQAHHAHLSQQPPQQQQLPQDPREGKGSQNFMMDCLRFQSQLLDRLNSIQPDPALTGPFPQATAVPMTQGEPVSMPGFTPTGTSTMDFTFETSVDMWKPEDGLKIQQQASPDSTYFQNLTLPGTSAAMVAEPAMTATVGAAPAAPVATARMADKNAPLEERFACIMGQVEAAGFESFDAMASAYYTQTFAQSSSLAHEQRLSRKRGLPQVLSDVHTATGQWSDWERNGFQEEILKTAETMLTSEGGNARQQLANKVDALLEAQNAGNAAASAEAVLSMKRTIQEQVRIYSSPKDRTHPADHNVAPQLVGVVHGPRCRQPPIMAA